MFDNQEVNVSLQPNDLVIRYIVNQSKSCGVRGMGVWYDTTLS